MNGLVAELAFARETTNLVNASPIAWIVEVLRE